MRLRCLPIAVALALSGAAAGAERPLLRVGMETREPPWAFVPEAVPDMSKPPSLKPAEVRRLIGSDPQLLDPVPVGAIFLLFTVLTFGGFEMGFRARVAIGSERCTASRRPDASSRSLRAGVGASGSRVWWLRRSSPAGTGTR